MKYSLSEVLTEFKEVNKNSLYEPVAVGKYGIRKRNEIYKKELSDDYSKSKVIRKDNLIIGMGSNQIDVGVMVYDEIYSVSPAYHTYKINTNIVHSDYLELLFKSNNATYFKKYSIATARQGKKIDLKALLQEIIDIPSFEEQDNLVSKISDIEDLIAEENKSISLLDELTKSRFIELFVNKGFGVIQIRNLVDLKKITAKKMYKNDDEFEYIDISSIDNQINEVTSSTTYKLSEAPSRAQQCLKNGDVLISTVRPNLRNIARFKGPDYGYVGSSGFCVLRPLKCDTSYLMYNVLSDDFTNSMARLTTGASYPAVRDDDVLNYNVIDAPLDIQRSFGEFVNQIDKLKFNVQQRIEKYKELLNKKMSEYFN